MGRPIQGKWFGLASLPGNQIVVTGVKFADGTTASNAYIVKQTGSAAYVVQDTALSHVPEIVFMVNAASTSALMPGQCYINATPFSGSALPCEKISQFRVSIYNVANTVPQIVGAPAVQAVSNYTWSTIPATKLGQADLISGSGLAGRILSVAVNSGGSGYRSAPAVTFNGGGTGATATATVVSGAVTSIAVNTAGGSYTTGSVSIAAPVTVTATGTAVVTTNAVTSVTGIVGGGYYNAVPTVTFAGGGGTGATGTAVLTAGVVTSVTIGAGGSGYTSVPTVTFSAPVATTATATATIST